MAAVDVGARNNPAVAADDLDDLFDYDVPADIFQDVDTNMEVPQRPAKAPLGDAGRVNIGGLGIDEEIKVTKKRAPVAKLDEDRLLSSAGIPKIRKITKERLRFKGKGHEYSDVARLLNVYQLWLDDLYPRAKFADGITMIEKLGHKKRLQIMRKEWINEGKPKDRFDDVELVPKTSEPYQPLSSSNQRHDSGNNPAGRSQTSIVENWTDYDLCGPQKQSREASRRTSQDPPADSLFIPNDEGNDAPPEDDLDALLAEDGIKAMGRKDVPQRQDHSDGQTDNNFEDELEAMAGLDDMW